MEIKPNIRCYVFQAAMIITTFAKREAPNPTMGKTTAEASSSLEASILGVGVGASVGSVPPAGVTVGAIARK